MMNRRQLLQGIAGLSAGLILPATVEENAEAVRRYWPGWSAPTLEMTHLTTFDAAMPSFEKRPFTFVEIAWPAPLRPDLMRVEARWHNGDVDTWFQKEGNIVVPIRDRRVLLEVRASRFSHQTRTFTVEYMP